MYCMANGKDVTLFSFGIGRSTSVVYLWWAISFLNCAAVAISITVFTHETFDNFMWCCFGSNMSPFPVAHKLDSC